MGFDEWYDGWDDLKEPSPYLLHMRHSRRDDDTPSERDEFADLYPDHQTSRYLEPHRLVETLRQTCAERSRSMELSEPLDALPDLILMLDHNTGNAWLDVGELSLSEGGGYPQWNPDDVAWLAEEWRKAEPPTPPPLTQQPQLPRLRLDFYNTAVLLSRWEDDGRLTTHPVSVHDVVSACTNVELSSGFLPANTLFWKQRANQAMLCIYVPARRWHVQCDFANRLEEQSYHIPMPPFVFVGSGSSYHLFAVKKRPLSEHARLYHAPCPNVHTAGGICQGNTPFPICSPQTIQQALHLFMEGSLFNVDLSRGKCQSHPDDVRVLWAELDGRKRLPLGELVPTGRAMNSII